jgi:hypothetical protein
MEVALVLNSNLYHHHSKPMTLTNEYEVRRYIPVIPNPSPEENSFNERVARVDFSMVTTILLIYNTTEQRLYEMDFVNAERKFLATLTLTGVLLRPYI